MHINSTSSEAKTKCPDKTASNETMRQMYTTGDDRHIWIPISESKHVSSTV